VSISKRLYRIAALPNLAIVVALAGGVVFLLNCLKYARFQASMLDEGTYLVKGFLFATGRYSPFQPAGPWTNQMPLSFLIPGFVQRFLGPGLATGRYFSIFLGLLMLLGLWLVARRLGGPWWAAGSVWIIAISPAFARTYSLAVSQSLAACMIVWVLVLVLSEKVPLWRLILAGLLTALLILTRNNLIPLVPFLLLFVFWQFGWRSGLWTMTAILVPLLVGHAMYYPEILELWVKWIPASITPFLDPWRLVDIGSKAWAPQINATQRLSSYLDSLRFNLVPVVALFSCGVLVVQPQKWQDRFHYHAAVFLTALSGSLYLAHVWASLFFDYCVFCLSGYLMFFSPLMILLVILAYQSWRPGRERWFSIWMILLTVLITTGIGFGAWQEVGAAWSQVQIPRIKAGNLQAGSLPLWGLVENGLGLDQKTTQALVPSLVGSALGLLLILGACITWRKGWLNRLGSSYGMVLLGLLLTAGVVLSPTAFLSKLDQADSCQGDVPAAMRQVGEYLAQSIPPGASVYWQGSSSAVPLLYIPDSEIYPAQLNEVYSYRQGGNPETLLRVGLWNEVLDARWKAEADFIILIENKYTPEWKTFLETGAFEELPRSPATDPCVERSRLRVFRRLVQ
jgi:hypothetical protein